MSRPLEERYADILGAIDRCLSYRPYLSGDDPDIASMAYDAVLRNVAVIGEAVKALPDGELDAMPEVPWPAIAGLRNVVVHEYFRIQADLIIDIVDNELIALSNSIRKRLS